MVPVDPDGESVEDADQKRGRERARDGPQPPITTITKTSVPISRAMVGLVVRSAPAMAPATPAIAAPPANTNMNTRGTLCPSTLHHDRALYGRAHHKTRTGEAYQGVQSRKQHKSNHADEEAVERIAEIAEPEDFETEARRHRVAYGELAEHDLDDLVEDEQQAESHEQFVRVTLVMNRLQQKALTENSDQPTMTPAPNSAGTNPIREERK